MRVGEGVCACVYTSGCWAGLHTGHLLVNSSNTLQLIACPWPPCLLVRSKGIPLAACLSPSVITPTRNRNTITITTSKLVRNQEKMFAAWHQTARAFILGSLWNSSQAFTTYCRAQPTVFKFNIKLLWYASCKWLVWPWNIFYLLKTLHPRIPQQITAECHSFFKKAIFSSKSSTRYQILHLIPDYISAFYSKHAISTPLCTLTNPGTHLKRREMSMCRF